MNKTNFFIPGKSIPKARPRTVLRGGFVHSYTPKTTGNFENLIKVCAEEAMKGKDFIGGLDGKGALKVMLDFNILKPKSKPKKCMYPVTKPDYDNLAKTVTDAMNKIVYRDDSQIVHCMIRKIYSEKSGVSVWVEEIE